MIADEGREVDHYLHEHPELKRAAYVWLTDFVGFLPLPAGGEREAFLAEDYNAEMVEHIARHPHVRDRSIFIGGIEDAVDQPLGPDLPSIREWTAEHFEFCGYITGSAPAGDRDALRAELGYRPQDRVCVVTVGGSGVGEHLLRRVAAAYPRAKELVPDLRNRVELKFKVQDHDGEMTVVSAKDASRTAVAKITVQPGARFPWHSHTGAVVVNIDQGSLTYVEGDDCTEHTYTEGTAFVDSGHGHVHSAYNPGTTETVLYATFFEAPREGPLNIPAPMPDCAQ